MRDLPEDHPPILQPVGVFQEPGLDGRTLTAYRLQNPSTISPDSALYLALGFLAPQATVSAGAVTRSETMLGRIIYATQKSAEKFALAVCTLDGKLYLVLHLTGLGRVGPEDIDLIRRIAQTAQDRGFEIETGPIRVGDIELKMPSDLRPLRRRDKSDDDPLVITPTRSVDFRFIKIGDELLTDNARLLSAHGPTQMPAPLLSIISSSLDAPADQRLAALLAVRYWQATGNLAANRNVTPFRVGNRIALATSLSAPNASTYRALWAVRLDDKHAVIMQLVSEPTGIKSVLNDAAQLLRSMGIEPPAPGSPGTPGNPGSPSPDAKQP
jgi:hypothetical protein